MSMDSDMDITGSGTELDFMKAAGAIAPLADATRPAAQGQSVRPKSTAVRRTQPQWLASARSRLNDTKLPGPPHNSRLTLAGQRQGQRTVILLDERYHTSLIPPSEFSRLASHESTNVERGASGNFSSEDAQAMFQNMLAKYSRDQTLAKSAESQELQDMKRTLYDLTGSLKNLTSKIDLMSLGRDHQFQSSPIHQVPDYTLSDSSSDMSPPRQSVRPIPAPRKSVALASTSTPAVSTVIPEVALQNVRRSKPLGDLPKFDGSGDLAVFKLLFQECIELNGWEDDKIITLWLKQCVTGSAKECILYENVKDSKTIFEKLDSRYGNHLLVQKYTIMLEKRYKHKNETMSDLANNIRRMVEAVYSDCDTYTRIK